MADNDDPTVNVKLTIYDKLRDDLRTAQARAYELERQLTAAQLADTSGTTKLLHDAFHAAIKVVQYAVGNLAPETVSGWPHKALTEIADAIEKIPGMDRHISELPSELRTVAKSAASYEQFRKERDANRVVVAASAEDFGPKTAEAALVHAAYTAPVPDAETPPGAAPEGAGTPATPAT